MKTYVISYIDKSSYLILNATVEAMSRTEACAQVKPDARLILSCVTIG